MGQPPGAGQPQGVVVADGKGGPARPDENLEPVL